jgi:SAM-dependent methyltransferase
VRSLRVMRDRLGSAARQVLPRSVLRLRNPDSTPVTGRVAFGDLRRTRPIDPYFGWDRGQPIDRYYIERFLADRAADVGGCVLEVGDATYTQRFGEGRVTRSEVLHVDPDAPEVTIVADLAKADHVPSNLFDCIILTQTLHLIFDVQAAVATLHRILAPGGVLLATVPGISQVDRGEWSATWYWSFTSAAARRTFESKFAADKITVEQHGSVLSAVALLEGLASHELTEAELEVDDPAYPVFVGVRAVKDADRRRPATGS